MASQLVSRSPQCLSCVRQLAGSLRDTFSIPGRQQIRGKKKLAKAPASVSVRLLQHTPSYGRRGSILRVPPGLMRNSFYPKQLAEYITPAQLKVLGEDAVVERDRNFKLSGRAETRRERKARLALEEAAVATEGKVVAEAVSGPTDSISEVVSSTPDISNSTPETIKIIDSVVAEKATKVAAPTSPDTVIPKVLNAKKAVNIMSKLLPANIEFFRTPAPDAVPRRRISPSIPDTSVISTGATQGKVAAVKSNKIMGSVSSNDIVETLNAVLAENEEGSGIVLSPENITFVGQEGSDGVQQLGRFEIDIVLEGARNVRRTITVSPQK